MGSITFNCKQALSILLTIAIVMMPFNAARAASLGGWTLGGSAVQGASVVLNASKELILNGAKKIANGTAKITPPPSSVAKILAGGAGAVALDLAVKELLGGVDYLLDPANNSITYTKKVSPNDASHRYFLRVSYSYKFPDLVGREISIGDNSLCAGLSKTTGSTSDKFNGSTLVQDSGNKAYYCLATFLDGSTSYIVNFSTITNPAYNPNAVEDNQVKSLPLSTVAQQVISMAQGGNPQAQQAIKAAADTMVAEAETDSTKARPIINQFEQTSKIDTSETSTSTSETTTTNTTTPNESATKTDTMTQFPVFCNWAPTICQAANVVIQKPAEWAESIKAAYDDAVDYFKNDEPNLDKETKLEFPQQENPNINTQINFSGNCPASLYTPYSFFGISGQIEFSFEPVCKIADFIKPVVITISAFASAMIIAGIRTEDD